MTIDTTTVSPGLGAPIQIADGIRNAGGIVADGIGNIFFDDNGYEDSLGVGVSADELNLLTAAQIAGGVTSFGYPDNYTDPNTGAFVGGAGVEALAAILHPLGLLTTGAAEIAFAPQNFPDGAEQRHLYRVPR